MDIANEHYVAACEIVDHWSGTNKPPQTELTLGPDEILVTVYGDGRHKIIRPERLRGLSQDKINQLIHTGGQHTA